MKSLSLWTTVLLLTLQAGVAVRAQGVPTGGEQPEAAEEPRAPAGKQADSGTSREKAKPKRRVAIEEVMVTAQKREENMQDVPISIQSFTGDELAAREITDPSQLPQLTPGLVYSSISRYNIIYLRGVGTEVFTPSAAPSVATYIDGIFFPFSLRLAKQFGKVERIEVLKGPQGTLFGRNSTGGAINIVMAEPAEEFQGSLELVAGNFDKRRAKLYLTGPLSEHLAASATWVYANEDEYYTLSPESPLDSLPDYEDKGLQGKLRWSPASWFEGTLSYFNFSSEGAGTNLVYQEEPKPLGEALGVEATNGDYKYSGDEPPFNISESEVAILTLKLFPGPFDIKTISGYQDHKVRSAIDFDGSPRPVATFRGSDERHGIPGQISESVTHELQILSNGDGWFTELFGRPFEWVIGFYYSDTTQGLPFVEFETLGTGDALNETLPGFTSTGTPTELLGDSLPTVGGTAVLSGIDEFESEAVFGQITWDVSDTISITLGGRLTTEEVTITDAATKVRNNETGEITTLNEYPEDTLSNDDFSPKIAIDVRPLPNILIYTSWQRAFKSGTFNVINSTEPPEEVEPEEITTTEIGVKMDLFDGRLRLNGAIFQNEIENLQTLVVSVQSGGAVSIENAAKVKIDGAEFTLDWSVIPDLVLNVGASYLDPVFTLFPEGKGYDEETGLFFEDGNFTGNRPPRSPELSGNAGLFYTLDLWRGALEAGIDAYYNDGYFFDNQNSAEQDAYHLVNARIGYLYQPWNFRLTAFGKNLNGEKYAETKFPFDFGTVARLAPPKTYGVRLNWDF